MKKCFLFILLLWVVPTCAQLADSFAVRMAWYGFNTSSDLLFVHTDKHIYTNNEFVWFSAWLLRTKVDSIAAHQFVSLTLVQAGTRQPVLHQKFVMVNGMSNGSLRLPDSTAPGEYTLLAYTNLMGRDSLPLALFSQNLSVRAIHQAEFVATMDMENDSTGGQNLLITVRDKNTYIPVRDAELQIRLGNHTAKAGKTAKNGIYRLPLQATDSISTQVINVRVKYKGDYAYLQNKAPAALNERLLDLRFYPEGGNLVWGVPGVIGWESKTTRGEPLAVKAVLYKDDHPFDTIRTNESGLGSFNLVPDINTKYEVRVADLPAGVIAKPPGYHLPQALATGIALQVPKAIAGDTLRFRIYTEGYQQVRMIVHNFRSIFIESVFLIRRGTQVLLPLDQIPKGLMAITLFDSVNRPMAERIFFSHYGAQAALQITPGKKTYEKREKVTLQFRIAKTDSTMAIASVACAQANRFDNSKQLDIESFALLAQELQNLPPNLKGGGITDTAWLEQVLLVRGWRKYNWQDMLASQPAAPHYYSPVLKGVVQRFGFGAEPLPIKKSVTVNLLGGANTFSSLTTDKQGQFTLAYGDLLVPQDNRVIFFAGDKGNNAGFVLIRDPFKTIDTRLARQLAEPVPNAGRFLQYSRDLVLPDFDKVTYLAQVTVTAKKSSGVMHGAANACGDYVCSYNIFNCPNHMGYSNNRLPEKGKSYNRPGGGTILYWGCVLEDPSNEAASQYDGIKIGKEFYSEDYTGKDSALPEYISTIYWSPMLVFDAQGKAECSFYTSDITGRFRIVVNGAKGNNLFHGTAVIDVK